MFIQLLLLADSYLQYNFLKEKYRALQALFIQGEGVPKVRGLARLLPLEVKRVSVYENSFWGVPEGTLVM